MQVLKSCLFGFINVDSLASDELLKTIHSQQASASIGAAVLGEQLSECTQCYVAACHKTDCSTNNESTTRYRISLNNVLPYIMSSLE